MFLVWIINGKNESFLIGVSYYGVEIRWKMDESIRAN